MSITRRRFLKTSALAVAGSGLSGAGLYGYSTRVETEWLQTQRVTIPMDRLPDNLDGFRIVLLSDFHLHPHTRIEFIREVIEAANQLNPDLIALTGDFVQRNADSIFELAPALARLNARLGLYAVLGNHDLWKGAAVVTQGLEEAGIPVLNNRGLTLEFQGTPFYLAGLDDAWSGRPNLAQALEDHKGNMPVILLAHEPDPADEYTKDPRISLQLSGHSHGGQVRFPVIGSPFLPPLGRKYERGLYRVRQTWLYTNCGVGVSVPIRLNCRPEITEITLVS